LQIIFKLKKIERLPLLVKFLISFVRFLHFEMFEPFCYREILMEAEENQPPPISSVSSQLPASGGVAPLMAGGADSAATAQRRERRNQRQAAHINQNHREREVSATGIK
jgi:hypothetical protein